MISIVAAWLRVIWLRGLVMHSRVTSLLLMTVLVCGCDQFSGTKNADSNASAAASAVPVASVTVAQVKESLTARNYGLAASQADQLAASATVAAESWLVIAEARAANDNRLGALAALEQALVKGMHDLGRIEASSYLAAVRDSSEYDKLLERFGLVKNLAKAGDAAVIQHGDAIEVKAGDVSVTLPN